MSPHGHGLGTVWSAQSVVNQKSAVDVRTSLLARTSKPMCRLYTFNYLAFLHTFNMYVMYACSCDMHIPL